MLLKVTKRFFRRLRMKKHGIYEQLKIERLPLAYNHGAWMVHPTPIDRNSIIYSFGVGSNIAWDLAMIERFGATIHAFDPTPRCVEWIRSQKLPKEFIFHDSGVGGTDGEMTFYPPLRPSSFNFSSIDRGKKFTGSPIEVPVKRLSSIMAELGHDKIDVLKMDIEGGEYAVIEDILSSNIKIDQILVEFHHNFRTIPLSRTAKAIKALNDRGYRIFHISGRGYEMSLINGFPATSSISSQEETEQTGNFAIASEMLPEVKLNSASETVEKFGTVEAATKYASSLKGTATHRREEKCIRKSLENLKSGSKVLDLPCGTGRFLPPLLDMGFVVTEADTSPHMLEEARQYAGQLDLPVDEITFVTADALETGFDDDQFDAVVCNRLVHHIREPMLRTKVLSELARISKGPIVVSFFCNLAWDAVVFHTRNALRKEKANDRIPIASKVFTEDVKRAGLEIVRYMPTRSGISRQWYAVLRNPAKQAAE